MCSNIAVDVRHGLVVARHGINQRIADNTRLSSMRIMAEVAVDGVIDLADHINRIR